MSASISVPSSRATPVARAVGGDDIRHRRFEDDLGSERLGGPGEHLCEAAVPALVEGPRAEHAVVLADVVIEQHQPRSL